MQFVNLSDAKNLSLTRQPLILTLWCPIYPMNLPLVKSRIGALYALPVDERDEVIRRMSEEDDLELRASWIKLGAVLKERDAQLAKKDHDK